MGFGHPQSVPILLLVLQLVYFFGRRVRWRQTLFTALVRQNYALHGLCSEKWALNAVEHFHVIRLQLTICCPMILWFGGAACDFAVLGKQDFI